MISDEAFMLSNIYDTHAFISHQMKAIFRRGPVEGINIAFSFTIAIDIPTKCWWKKLTKLSCQIQ